MEHLKVWSHPAKESCDFTDLIATPASKNGGHDFHLFRKHFGPKMLLFFVATKFVYPASSHCYIHHSPQKVLIICHNYTSS